ncbi:hypothetical protein [Erythrobacter rubeus]|uniref:Uncharacterized protein n=1 Tax=Erythrobacter rubeus TaxID=2760803 RepID=A0ABR8KVL8_9SPHN|nr:hypothetical protein [Erythrobacter rubeus]MBD2843425.1 hypothetical protein [Erythrobacter rubeus]
MIQYSLKFAADNSAGEQTVSFYAHSTAGALEIAKNSADGDWAELYQGDALVCRMRLVEETGVWLVEPSQSRAQG